MLRSARVWFWAGLQPTPQCLRFVQVQQQCDVCVHGAVYGSSSCRQQDAGRASPRTAGGWGSSMTVVPMPNHACALTLSHPADRQHIQWAVYISAQHLHSRSSRPYSNQDTVRRCIRSTPTTRRPITAHMGSRHSSSRQRLWQQRQVWQQRRQQCQQVWQQWVVSKQTDQEHQPAR